MISRWSAGLYISENGYEHVSKFRHSFTSLWNFECAHTPTSNCSGLLIITLCILAVVHTCYHKGIRNIAITVTTFTAHALLLFWNEKKNAARFLLLHNVFPHNVSLLRAGFVLFFLSCIAEVNVTDGSWRCQCHFCIAQIWRTGASFVGSRLWSWSLHSLPGIQLNIVPV